ncbi:hypothetical protein PHAVU_011G066800 [Phaseolus vulgaris]|uniref:C2H2-type domain-containing protein n=1 Tax=Phaseolus vulgaris TaxID=3885 RepID=V7AEX5_PHAVU|nr:hypothetical protein PHAVU_011G066800g [Phaseolus vulgaris]ESW04094.1 hypothetical protein PHAVU_011G066800g [Phaseolus vulgaris]
MSKCLMLVEEVGEGASRERVVKSGEFKCKTCDKQFPSFQALGGHRASHKKLKRMASNLPCSVVTPKLHQCSICGLVFGIGQALGGHMRKHRVSSIHHHHQDLPKSSATKNLRFCFDLNLTPYENHLNLNLRTPVSHLFM